MRKNSLFVETHADACSFPVLVPNESEMVLVGSAMLAACASKTYSSLESASKEMASKCKVIHTNSNIGEYHERKYKVFRQMVEDQLNYKRIMNS